MDKIQKEPMIKQERGITLIALIITIIVLLILAGVSIAMLTGENGILNRAEETSYAQAQGELTEVIGLSITETLMYTDEEYTIDSVIDRAVNNGYISLTDGHKIDKTTDSTGFTTECVITHTSTGAAVKLTQIAADGSIGLNTGEATTPGEGTSSGLSSVVGVQVEGDTTIKDADGEDITIPGGFGVPVDTDEDPLEDRDSIEEGFVIEDKDGNQFVWVVADVENSVSAAALADVEKDGIYASTSSANHIEPIYLTSVTSGDASSNNTVGVTEDSLRKEFEEMQASVVNRGGFYIMRYEISYADDNTAASIKGATAVTARESLNKWWGLYALAKTYVNGDVKGTMLTNSQYNILIEWVTEEEIAASGRNSSDTTTGTDESDKIRNIYDLTGGRKEWTTGGYSEHYRLARGGETTGYDTDARYVYYATVTNSNLTTRTTLIW